MPVQLDNGYIFVPHKEWSGRVQGLRSGGKPAIPQVKGAKKVYIHHSVTIAQGDPAQIGHLDPSDDPCRDARKIEDILFNRGLLPGYSHMIHPSGVVLEGAGRFIGAHTHGQNSTSKGLVLIGNFDIQQPTLAAIIAASRTINLMRLDGQVAGDMKQVQVLGHRDSVGTACPGANLYPLIPFIWEFADKNR